MSAAPTESSTVANYYKQTVHDPKQSKIVIVPFTVVKTCKKDDKWWLTLDQAKDDLKAPQHSRRGLWF